jgi:hypothetical protein
MPHPASHSAETNAAAKLHENDRDTVSCIRTFLVTLSAPIGGGRIRNGTVSRTQARRIVTALESTSAPPMDLTETTLWCVFCAFRRTSAPN